MQIFDAGELIATHGRRPVGKATDLSHYPPEMIAFRMRTPTWCRSKAAEVAAILADAIMQDDDLIEANLADADLTRADLTGVDFTDADLTGIDVTDAIEFSPDSTEERHP